jgi:hypothetical protein
MQLHTDYDYEVFLSQTPPAKRVLDELGRLKGGWAMGLGVARCAPY